jgi:uncharacterized protein
MTDHTDDLVRTITGKIRSVDPDARVILFGSRARGDARQDSDWDILVVTQTPEPASAERQILDDLYDLELDTGAVIMPVVCSEREWNDPMRKGSPFVQQVRAEGKEL